MVKRSRPPQWHLLFTAGGLLAAVAVAVYVSLSRPGGAPPSAAPPPAPPPQPVVHADALSFGDSLVAQADSVLGELGVLAGSVRVRRGDEVDTVDVRVPGDLPLASANLALTELAGWHGGGVVRGVESGADAVELTVGHQATATTLFRLRHDLALRRRSGHLALVLTVADAAAQARAAAIAQPLTMVLGAGLSAPAAVSGDSHQWATRGQVPAVTGADTLRPGPDGAAGLTRDLWALAERAADAGHAVAVVEAGPAALEALEATLPRLERRGYRFVTLAQLARDGR